MLKYSFVVHDGYDQTVFVAQAPTIEMLEEKIGSFERHFKPMESAEEVEEELKLRKAVAGELE